MGQVVKFFGYLIMAVGTALVVFGHISIIFVHGWDYLVKQISASPWETLMWILVLVPGALVYGLGALIDHLGRRADAKGEAEQAGASDQAES